MSNKNVTGTLLIVATTEKEELGLIIDTIELNNVSALIASLGGRAASPRETSFPDSQTSFLAVHSP